MSWKEKTHRATEQRVVKDALHRFVARGGAHDLPISEDEMLTLTKRSRDAFFGDEQQQENLEKYKKHLSQKYGVELIKNLSAIFEEIHGEFGSAEK